MVTRTSSTGPATKRHHAAAVTNHEAGRVAVRATALQRMVQVVGVAQLMHIGSNLVPVLAAQPHFAAQVLARVRNHVRSQRTLPNPGAIGHTHGVIAGQDENTVRVGVHVDPQYSL